ncbi:MAG: transcription termination factor Rho [candidate division Zixibacteria bacterium]|nr:transcription termination factor Rho [candidate division Zixibacteria bacterium]
MTLTKKPEQDLATGILKITGEGSGVLGDPKRSFRAGPDDILVGAGLIRKYSLVQGVKVTGPINRKGNQPHLIEIESICGLDPSEFAKRTPYTRLTAIDPCQRFDLSVSSDLSVRIIDFIAPIGKGTRGLIVSPPKAGKTTILEQLANAINKFDPETRIIMLLIDERPEEVTHISRSVKAEVFASTKDQSAQEQVELANLLLANISIELECGRDLVVLVDSLTRMGRAFNVNSANSGKTLSGGIDARALEIPRRFFGLARNIENGGSVTIIATALIDTGSRMDELIFQEFKGTGNSELILERKLAEKRIFPAININESGTRKEEKLHSSDNITAIYKIRRELAELDPETAMESLLQLIEQYPSNEELFNSI